jgi:pimeloyl-ACP methyl ester carboxylesterase
MHCALRIRRILLRLLSYYAVASLIFSIALGEVAFRADRVPIDQRQSVQAMAARFGAVLQDVSITASNHSELIAWYARPANWNGDAVILLHGVGDNRQGMSGFAELFLSHGYSVLLPDSRGQGLSQGSLSYGVREKDDVRHWFEWINLREKPNCVFGMGESMGAAIVLQATTTTPFCAVVAESSFASFRQIAFIRVGQMFHAGSWVGRIVLRPSVEGAFLYGWLTRRINLAEASPEQSVLGLRIPVLLIHGLADKNIPARQSELIHDRNPSDITLWEVPRAGHCGAVSVAYDEFNSRVLGWFSSHRGNDAGAFKRSNGQ